LLRGNISSKNILQYYEVLEFIDDGYSGTAFHHPQFQRMSGDARNGRINCVVVKDLSRFVRNYIQSGGHTDYLFPSLGCRFIAINEGIDTLEKKNGPTAVWE